MKWLLILIVIVLVIRWLMKRPYQNQELLKATSARATVVLSNGVRSAGDFELDVRSSMKMPTTNKPCYMYMLDTDYLVTWAAREHNSTVSHLDPATLSLRGPEGQLDMSHFTWSILYDSNRNVAELYIREK